MTNTATHPADAAPTLTSIDVGGERTSYRRAGEGHPLLFLHGAFFPTSWTRLHGLLADSADLIAPIHPGYVEGAPPDWLRGFDDLVLHYHDLLDAFEVSQVDLVGYDLGGWIAATIACFYPERVRTLTLVASSGLLVPGAPALEFLAADPRRVVDALFNGAPPEDHRVPDPSDIAGFVERYGENGVTARLIWERRYDTRLDRRVSRLAMPVLVIGADDDRIIPAAHARRWASLIPDSRLVMLDGCGHALPLQAADDVAAAITTFLTEVSS
jgi:pimeloyl-ACP methyl ester carboxylesterase